MAIKKTAKKAKTVAKPKAVELELKIRRLSRNERERVMFFIDNESEACGSGRLTTASGSVPPTKKVVFGGEIEAASDAHKIVFKNVRLINAAKRRAPQG